MIANDTWKKVMKDGVERAYLLSTISILEAVLFHQSINAKINIARMNRDSKHRLNRKRGLK